MEKVKSLFLCELFYSNLSNRTVAMIQKVLLFIFLNLLLLTAATAQVTWDYEAKKVDIGVYDVVFTADVQEGWFIYSQFISDDGPIPTTFTFDENQAVGLVGKAEEKGYKKEGYDEIFGMNLIKFGKNVTFTQRVNAKAGTTVGGYLTFMTCNDEQCLPPKDVDFSVTLP